MQMKQLDCFTNLFLIAMPALQGSFFEESVIYLHEHSAEGATGIVINKPLQQVTLQNLLEHLDIVPEQENIANLPVLSGGPVGLEQGFIIHDQTSPSIDEQKVTISSSKEILADISQGKGPSQFIIALGYAGWEKSQLEDEVGHNDWLLAPFCKKILFNIPMGYRWRAAAKMIGVDLNCLSGQSGNA